MSITLFTGTPGSGKSFHCTEIVVNSLKKGINIITNYPIDTSKIKDMKGEYIHLSEKYITVEYLKKHAKKYHVKGKEKQTIVIIDEAQLLFNSRDWNSPDRKEWCSFFTIHRHLGFDFILATQKDDFIDKQIRGLIEYNHIHRNLKKSKLNNIFPFMPTIFVEIVVWYSNNMKISSRFFRYKNYIGEVYDSYIFFDKLLKDVTTS